MMYTIKDFPEAQYWEKYKLSEAFTDPVMCAMLTPLTFNKGDDFDFVVRDCESGLDYKCKFSSLLNYLEEGMEDTGDNYYSPIPEVTIKERIGDREVTTTIKGNVGDIKKLMEGLHE